MAHERRDLWHIPSEPRVAASKPRLCTCLLICFHEVFGEGNFCDFCNADASDECECAGEYRGPLNRRCYRLNRKGLCVSNERFFRFWDRFCAL